MYQKLVKKVQEGMVHCYWLEDELLHAKRSRLFIPQASDLRKELLKETYNTQWVRHLGREMRYVVILCFDFWLNMEDEIEVSIKTYGICQLDKPKKQKKVGLLQPLHVVGKPWLFVSMEFISGLLKVNGLSFCVNGGRQVLKVCNFHCCSITTYYRASY